MPNAELYDTHCHLDFSEFDEAREALLKSCYRRNITKLLIPSVERGSWAKVQDIARGYEQVFYALGLHPLFIEEHSIQDLDYLKKQVYKKSVDLVAIGEIGLDAEASDMELQQVVFAKQLAIAEECGLPVIMHARRTHSQILSELKRVNVAGVIHAFSGGEALLRQYLAKGVSIGVGCVITWPSAKRTRASIASAPIESLLLETDSPAMRVYGNKKSGSGSPLDLLRVFSVLCEIRSEEPEVLARALRDNADRLFFNRAYKKK